MSDLIDRADAIKHIKAYRDEFKEDFGVDSEEGDDASHHFGYIAGLNRATRIIKDLPSLREEMILECTKCVLDSTKTKKGKWEKQFTRHFLDSRVNVGVEMKEATGRGYHTYVNLMCTNCRKVTMVSESILYKYCPHCGAAMEVTE